MMDKNIFNYEAQDLIHRYMVTIHQDNLTERDAINKIEFQKLFMHILSLWVAEYTKLWMNKGF